MEHPSLTLKKVHPEQEIHESVKQKLEAIAETAASAYVNKLIEANQENQQIIQLLTEIKAELEKKNPNLQLEQEVLLKIKRELS
jgi:hypothetical protein